MIRRLGAVIGLALLVGVAVGAVGRLPGGSDSGSLQITRDAEPPPEASLPGVGRTESPEADDPGTDPAAGSDRRPRNRRARTDPEQRIVAHPVAPDTLAARRPPYEFSAEGYPTWAVSDDGGRFAATTGRLSGSTVTLAVAGTGPRGARRLVVPRAGPVEDLQFSPEGDALLWLQPGDRSSPGRLHHLTLGRRAQHTPTPLDGPAWHEWRALPGGRVGAFSFARNWIGRHVGAEVAVVDAARGAVVSTARLHDVAAPAPDPRDGDAPADAEHWPGLAWDVDRAILYLAHAAEDRLTVVELAGARATVAEVDLGAHPDVGASSPAANDAGTGVGLTRRATLSPDGARLYLTGTRSWPDVTGPRPRRRAAPLGLQVVDVASSATVAALDLPIDNVMVTPDGRHLLASGSSSVGDRGGVEHRLWLLDAGTLAEVDVPGRGGIWPEGFSADGRFAYVSHWGASEGVLEVVDLHDRVVVTRQRLGGRYAEFLPDAGLMIEWPA